MGLISILFALLIVGSLFFFTMKAQSPTIKSSEKKLYQEAGVDTTNYKGMIERAKKAAKQIEEVPTGYPYNME